MRWRRPVSPTHPEPPPRQLSTKLKIPDVMLVSTAQLEIAPALRHEVVRQKRLLSDFAGGELVPEQGGLESNLYPSKAVYEILGEGRDVSCLLRAEELDRETNAPLAANAVPTIPATAAVRTTSSRASKTIARRRPSPRSDASSLYVVARLDAPLARRGSCRL